MNKSIIEELQLISTSYYIGIPYTEWSAQNSYLVCRALVDECVISRGVPLIGTRRELKKEASKDGDYGVYTLGNTQYGWISLPDGTVIDPCEFTRCTVEEDEPHFSIRENQGCYMWGVDPTRCSRSELPQHHIADEIFNVKRGVMRELCSRILGYTLQVEGLTMAEAAYIASQPLSAFDRHSRLIYEHFMMLGLNKLLPLTQVSKVHPLIARKSWRSFLCDTDSDGLKLILQG
ncbi:hypothetical protein [Photorhabdus asymbiotica]|uniref:hypothetical protein n=1 Tax=Photorhabdus asymbiotica TaxID=291112 RepID=UPI003DA7802A